MMYFHILITYLFVTSAVLFYGIEIGRTIQIATSHEKIDFKVYLKIFSSVIISSILSFLVTDCLLIPLHLGELFPLLTIIIFLCINTFIEAMIRLTAGISTSEFAVSWLIVYLSVSESTSLLESLLISVSCCLSFVILHPIVCSFQKRMHDHTDDNKEKMNVFLFVSIAVLIILSAAFDVSWLNLKK